MSTTIRLSQISWRRVVMILFCALSLLAVFPYQAFAHPMGNFSVNRYSRLQLESETVELLYIVDMAEIPTHAERSAMDSDGDTVISSQEAQHYLAGVAAMLPSQLLLTLNNEQVAWTPLASRISFPAGQANLPTMRMEFEFSAPLSASGSAQQLEYVAQSYEGRLGWQEVIVVPSEQVELIESDVPQNDLSNQLHEYNVDLLQNPPAVKSANLSWQPAVGLSKQNALQDNSQAASSGMTSSLFGPDRFSELISIPDLGAWAVVLALLAAFGWGAAHALSPGHGKTIVAAYLVGARGTFAHALFLGATTTITHTLGVFVLGLATLLASQYILPERLYPWLSTISGLLVISIGVSIGWNRLRSIINGEPDHHAHEHDDGDGYNPGHIHAHTQGRSGHTHSHIPPSGSGSTVSWRGLLALGISGGILPCPSALVVLLGAIAMGRVAFGLVLILVFSLGLATVLTGFGLLLLRAGKLFERIPESSRYARYLAVASAAFITLVGAGITVQALIETGIFVV